MYCYPRNSEVVLKSNLVDLTTAEAVSVEDFKTTYGKIDDDTEDDAIENMIEAATVDAELFTRRAIRDGSWESKTDRFYYLLTLDVSPVDASSIEVKYFDANNVEQTLDEDEYTVKDFGPNAFVQIVFDGTMPTIYDRYDAVKIEFNAGYEIIPGPITLWIKQRAASYFENRQDQVIGSLSHSVYNYAPLMPYKLL